MLSRSLPLLLACLFLSALLTFGQGGAGTITGILTDPAGAVIAGATVQARNSATGQAYEAASTATGNYTVVQLPYGTYEVSVNVQGFKKYVHSNLLIQVAQTLREDIQMEVGSAVESVTVTSEANMLKTESGELAHQVTISRMVNLPILAVGGTGTSASMGVRDPWSLVLLLPGTSFTSNTSMVVNGAPANTQSIRLEGMDASMNDGSSTQRVQPSVDAIEEVAVQTSNFSAEFGTVGGGLFNVTMKSGTNQFHGSAYDYAANEALNSHQPYTGARSTVRRHNYGGTLGGPVLIPKLYDGRNRTFFFFNYEEFRENAKVSAAPAAGFPTVPIPAYRVGDFNQVIIGSGVNGATRNIQVGGRDYIDPLGRTTLSGAIFDPSTERRVGGVLVRDQFPNNRIPTTRLDPVAVKVLGFVPLPSTSQFVGQNYRTPWVSKRTTAIPSFKIDQSIGSKGHLAFFWDNTGTDSQYSAPNANAEGLPEPITVARGTFIHTRIVRINYDHTITPTLLLHLGAGYFNQDFDDRAGTTDFDAVKELGLRGATINRTFPIFTTGASLALGGMNTLGVFNQGKNYLQKPQGNASLSLVRQSHSIKIGSEWRSTGYPGTNYTGTAGSYTFDNLATTQTSLQGEIISQGVAGFPLASFMLGNVATASLTVPIAAKTGQQQWALFVQDTWKVTRKLTLDLGLRWDYGTYSREQYGRYGTFSPSTPNPNANNRLGATIFEANCNCRFAENYPYAVGPRLGVAYQIDSKTVLRAGFGLVYNATVAMNRMTSNTASAGSAGFGEALFQLRDGMPASVRPQWPDYSPGTGFTPGAIGTATPFVDANSGRPARQAQWSIGLQRAITPNLVVEASYVANRGVWWNAGALTANNAMSEQLLARYGFTNFTSATDASLLNATIGNLTAAQRGIMAARGLNVPYASFPTTQIVRQSLLPFPQYTGLINPVGAPLGKTWYDSLQTTVTKRYSHGLSVNGNFTWSKTLSLLSSPDVFNRQMGKNYSTSDIPFQLRVSASYTVPKLRNTKGILGNKGVQYLLADWGLGWYGSYQSAPLLIQPASSGGTPISQFLGRGPGPAQLVEGQSLWSTDWTDLDGNHHTDPIDINCHCYDPTKTIVLNPKAWANIPAGQWGAQQTGIRYFRGIRYPLENLNFSRNFRFKEKVTLHLRAEFTNVFNRTRLPQPSTGAAVNYTASPMQANGRYTGGFGTIVPTGGTNDFRTGILVARLQF